MPHILVVDDAPDQIHIITGHIRAELPEAKITTCETIPQALSAINQRMPDLLILDLVLKDGSGEEILKYVRQKSKTVPVLIVTGTKTEEILASLFDQQANDFVLKPIDDLIFQSKLRSLLTARYISPLLFQGLREGIGTLTVDIELKLTRLSEYHAQLSAPFQLLPGAPIAITVGEFVIGCKVTKSAPRGGGQFDIFCDVNIKSITDRPALRKLLLEKSGLNVKVAAA